MFNCQVSIDTTNKGPDKYRSWSAKENEYELSHLVLNFLLWVVCFLNMPSKQSTSGRVRGKNYNATDDRLLIELVIEHAEELGVYDSLNYAWKTRISHASVKTCFVVDI